MYHAYCRLIHQYFAKEKAAKKERFRQLAKTVVGTDPKGKSKEPKEAKEAPRPATPKEWHSDNGAYSAAMPLLLAASTALFLIDSSSGGTCSMMGSWVCMR